MERSIAARYAARQTARFVSPSAKARERRLGLRGAGSFRPASAHLTVLHRPGGSVLARLRGDPALLVVDLQYGDEPGDVGVGAVGAVGDEPQPLKFAAPLLMETRFPLMKTPPGLISMEFPADLMVNPMPASITAVRPALRWIIMPASMA